MTATDVTLKPIPSLETALQSSVLTGTLYRWANDDTDCCQQKIQASHILRAFRCVWQQIDLFLPKLENTSTIARLLKRLCLAALLVLFIGSTVYSTAFVGVMTGVLLVLVALTVVLTRQPLIVQWTAIDSVVVVFFTVAVISTAFSSEQPHSWIGLSKMLTFLASYLAFRWFAGQWPLWLVGFGAMGVLAVGQSLMGWEQYHQVLQPLATWQDPELDQSLQLTRVYGTIQPLNPNLLAGYLAPCFPPVLLATLFFANRWITGAQRLKVRHLLYGLPTILSLAGTLLVMWALVATGSRGAFLAIGGMALTAFLYSGHLIFHDETLKKIRYFKQAWLGILGVSLVGGLLAVMSSPALQHRVASIFAMHNDSSIAYRLNVYASAWQMFKDNWWVGIGPGNDTFKQIYGLYMVPGYNALGAYSVPLEIAVEQGIAGLLSFVLLFVVILFRGVRLMDEGPCLVVKVLGGILLMSLMAHFAYGLFDTVWYRPAVNSTFWYALACFAVLTQYASRPTAYSGKGATCEGPACP